MRYIIDACNLIFSDNKLEETLDKLGFQAARALLTGMLSRFAASENLDEIVAVFDGSEKGAHRPRRHREACGRVVLVYADPRTDADRYIIEYVENAKQPGEITVVSSDKFITREVARFQAHRINSRDFLRQMRRARVRAADPMGGEDPRKFYGSLSPREVDEWMKFFGFDASD